MHPLLLLILVIITIPGIYGFAVGIGYFPSSRKAIKEMQDLMPLKPGDVVYDLGTGEGRLIYGLVGKRRDVTGHGYELFWPVYLIAKFRSFFHPNIHIHFANFYLIDFTQATHIVCFLHPDVFKKLLPTWEQQLKPGTIIASATFPIHAWDRKEIHAERVGKHVYLYVV